MEKVDGQWFSSFFCRLDKMKILSDNLLSISITNSIDKELFMYLNIKYSIHWYYYSQCICWNVSFDLPFYSNE